MGDKVDASPDKQPHPVDSLMRRVKEGKYNMSLIKEEVDNMEERDRNVLGNQLGIELAILKRDTKSDPSLVLRLNDLEDHLKEAEKSFGTKTQEVIGAGLNTAIDSLGSGAKKGVEIVGDQVKKGTDAVVQIGAQVADVIADPNRSQKEKIIHVTGLAAMVAVPAGLLYLLCSKMSGANLKEGEKPGFGRTLLKWTGFAFLGGLGVRALAPWVSETQRGFMIQQQEAASAEKKNDALIKEATVGGMKFQIVGTNDRKVMVVNGVRCAVNRVGQKQDITNLEAIGDTLRIRMGAAVIDVPSSYIPSFAQRLKTNGEKIPLTVPVPGKNGGTITLEFVPEKTS